MKTINVRHVMSQDDMLASAWVRTLSFAPQIQYYKPLVREEYRQLKNQLDVSSQKIEGNITEQYISMLAECDEDQVLHQEKREYQNLKLDNSKIAVGTFDIVLTRALDGEVLLGNCRSIGYIANYCVVSFARRKGIASLLINEARRLACLFGAEALFVHVKADNLASLSLFQKNNFVMENDLVHSEKVAPIFAETGHAVNIILFRDNQLWQ
eukprot:TRINITY_DN14265_c0_g1_i1.p1 TRINITY_DN14265_c0_g1~~TRINITY_DN14265_c0_g1_i1.p1  ORF type:complete len:211 (-),score=30.54 TRINITY_DN14265_c0_g1_i1:121-753(-)